jgi:hypothetical protein
MSPNHAQLFSYYTRKYRSHIARLTSGPSTHRLHSDLILSGVDETSNETKNLLVKPKKSGDKPRKRSDRERCASFPLTTIYETLHDIAKHNHNLDPSKCELVARPCNLEIWYKNNRATSGAVNGFTEYKEELMLERFKARLVAKGAEQRGRSRFHRHFPPCCSTHISTCCTYHCLIFLVGHYINWMSIMLAFLHGDLEEPVYMLQPPGLTDPTYPQHVIHSLIHTQLSIHVHS